MPGYTRLLATGELERRAHALLALADAPLGGLGLPLIRRCSDWMSYRHEGGRNHFVFGARWSKP